VIDCTHGPVPHDAPAGIASCVVHDPSQEAGGSKAVDVVPEPFEHKSFPAETVGMNAHAPSGGSHEHAGHVFTMFGSSYASKLRRLALLGHCASIPPAIEASPIQKRNGDDHHPA
jgi:hypothetical protein